MAEDVTAFAPLPLRRKSYQGEQALMYRIVSSSGEEQRVQAATAYEALKQSGMKNAIRIERFLGISSERAILESKKLQVKEDKGSSDRPPEDTASKLLRTRTPILTPDTLDHVMQHLQARAKSHVQEKSQEPASETLEIPAHVDPESTPLPTAELEAMVPAENTAAVEAPSSVAAIGMDVHNDGFDEIIPASKQASTATQESVAPPVATSAQKSTSVIPPQPSSVAPPPVPEKELSPEEIDALMNSGNPPTS